MRLDWLPAVLATAGVTVKTVGGWETRGNDSWPLRFNPTGIVWHHTATSALVPTNTLLALIIHGRADLPGPLAQLVLERDGTFYVVASGKANHAGAGSWLDMKSNYHVVGIEAANRGNGETWPTAQLEAYRRGTKAILDKLGVSEARMCGHKEWAPTRKIDPYGLTMPVERRLVGEEEMVLRESTAVVDAVKSVQRALNRWGGMGLTVDGVFGPATVAAVKQYQSAADIPATGEVDGVTMGLLGRFDPA